MRTNTACLLALGALSLGSFAACDTSNPTGPGNPGTSVTAVNVTVPSTTLAMPTILQATATVVPATAAQTVTWSSSNPQIALVNPQGSIQPQLQGTVTITATSTVDASVSGSVTLTIVCPDPRMVSSVSGTTTWDNWIPDPACFDYVVQSIITLDDETLTIEPGARVGFEEDDWLRIVADGGALVAVGTATEPVVLTAYQSTAPGFWRGVQFSNSDNTINHLEHLVVEYSGSRPIGTIPGANIEVGRDSRVRMSHTTSRHSAGYGLYAPSDAFLDDFHDNTFTMNGEQGVYLGARLISSLMTGNSFTGNAIDEIRVETGTGNEILQDSDWLNPGVPYYLQYFNGRVWNITGAQLTLAPGVTLLFGDDMGMAVLQGAHLVAVGDNTGLVTLDARGQLWQGLQFAGGTGLIEQASIINAGSRTGGANVRAAVTVANAPDPSHVDFGQSVSLAGTDYEIAFGNGQTTTATGCLGRIYVQVGGGTVGDHCK